MTSIAPDTTTAGDTITPCPPPWLCKATIYAFAYWTPAAAAKDPAFASAHYAPLEREAPFASPEWGTPRGGLSMIQLIRYTETPTGPYDELVILPGSFEYPAPDGDKSGKKTLTAPRISRIYVSQRNTCWNGRKSEYQLNTVGTTKDGASVSSDAARVCAKGPDPGKMGV